MNIAGLGQVIIGIGVVVPLAVLSTSVIVLNKTLAAVEERVSHTDSRLNRIAERLPELKSKIAWEETRQAITGFLVITKPVRQSSGRWFTTAAIYNRDKSELSVFSLQDTSDKQDASYLVAGKLRSGSPHDVSFTELIQLSAELEESVFLPANVNRDTSFVLRSADLDTLKEFLETHSAVKVRATRIGRINNWQELVAEFDTVNHEINKHVATQNREIPGDPENAAVDVSYEDPAHYNESARYDEAVQSAE